MALYSEYEYVRRRILMGGDDNDRLFETSNRRSSHWHWYAHRKWGGLIHAYGTASKRVALDNKLIKYVAYRAFFLPTDHLFTKRELWHLGILNNTGYQPSSIMVLRRGGPVLRQIGNKRRYVIRVGTFTSPYDRSGMIETYGTKRNVFDGLNTGSAAKPRKRYTARPRTTKQSDLSTVLLVFLRRKGIQKYKILALQRLHCFRRRWWGMKQRVFGGWGP